jgi:hypothetical protein
VIDSDGRLFGRFNLVDAAAIAFALFLIPVGYATFLLFRPSSPVIDSVTRVEVTNEERRVSGVGTIISKFKVKGSGFNPLLRARVGDAEAMGFRFENPNSADVIVGIVPPGRHDLVLFDGVQEVARAREAIEIKATEGPAVRAYGWLTNLAASEADALKPGFASDPQAPSAFQILAIGPPQPARSRIAAFGESATDLPVAGRVERQAELLVRCDWPSPGVCTIDGASLTRPPPIVVTLPGPFAFHLEEVAPPVDPRRAIARVQLSGPVPAIKVGDRDASVGSRMAEIVSVGAGSNPIVTLRLGIDESREGWRYRGQLLVPGAPFRFRSTAYVAGGTIVALSLEP